MRICDFCPEGKPAKEFFFYMQEIDEEGAKEGIIDKCFDTCVSCRNRIKRELLAAFKVIKKRQRRSQ